jgi:hypothetical protein
MGSDSREIEVYVKLMFKAKKAQDIGRAVQSLVMIRNMADNAIRQLKAKNKVEYMRNTF